MMLMWQAGLLGTQGMMHALGTLTCIQINKTLAKKHKAFQLKDVMPDFVELTTRVFSKEEQAERAQMELVKYSHAHVLNIVELIEAQEKKRVGVTHG